MPTMWRRDLEADGAKFERWLRARLPHASDLRMSPLVSPTSSGFSNETLLFDLAWSEGGRAKSESKPQVARSEPEASEDQQDGAQRGGAERRSEKLVVRIQPIGYQVFPEYDLGLQFRTMQLLSATDVPVPRMLWLESEDTGIFGAPFYVMAQVAGRVPTDQPPYHSGGWMTEISPAEREAIWLGGFDAMARIHRLDLDATGFGFLRRPALGATPLDQEIAYYEKYYTWAACGRENPTLEAAHEWLVVHKPGPEREGLVWGDARIGNMIFDGTKPAAVLDWEMVSAGSPERDVGWAIFLDRHHSEGIDTPRLEGFPSYEDTLAYYEERSGHRIRNLHYYQVFAGWRFGIIMLRIAQQVVHYELATPEQGRELELDNTVTRLTAKLLDLPAPGAITRGDFSTS